MSHVTSVYGNLLSFAKQIVVKVRLNFKFTLYKTGNSYYNNKLGIHHTYKGMVMYLNCSRGTISEHTHIHTALSTNTLMNKRKDTNSKQCFVFSSTKYVKSGPRVNTPCEWLPIYIILAAI